MNKWIFAGTLIIVIGIVAFFVLGSSEVQAPDDSSTFEDLVGTDESLGGARRQEDSDSIGSGNESAQQNTDSTGTQDAGNTGAQDTDTESDTSTAHSSQTHKMVFGPNGYEPRDITVRQGDKIVFSTTESKQFWPASNVHPTHRIFSEFDPREPIQPEDTWSFTFTRVGTWGYHDHLAPIHTGEITVTE